MEPVVDQTIYSNRYQVTHLIARGGMAMVYRAHDLLLNRFVALKILYPELSVDRTFVERFRREAQAAANLSHPNIVPIFDWGEENGTYFIVMELIEGTSLAELLRNSRTLSPAKSAQVCAQVASALGYAHRQGVVHRDVKPGNILLTDDQQVKVTDFGIAQAMSTEDNLTMAGSVMGTATYFSPEQAEGALVDGRSDVYSLGVVLYELLAGRPPFMGESPVAVASKHVREVAPLPSQFNPALPTDLEAVTMHALAKNPNDRYQTADELRSDLLRFVEGQPVSVAGRNAFMADDATRAVAAVAPMGERTQAVPIMTGPRTDIRKKKNRTPLIAGIVALVLLLTGVGAYALLAKTATTTMPDLVGQTLTNANTTLHDDGLVSQTTLQVSSTVPAGSVISTNPKAGVKVTKGQLVSLVVSQGSTSTPVTIPPVVGQSLTEAQSTLQSLQLSVKVEFTSISSGSATPNTVLDQYPPGGTKGQTGDLVTLTVLTPGSTFPLPDVTGKSVVDAATQLGNAGLTISEAQGSACSNTIPAGNVVKTSPAAGQPVKSQQSIELIVSTGVCNVSVPNVTTANKATATSVLTSAGFVASFVNSTSTQCATLSDQVLSQSPAQYSQAPYGSTVVLQYCPINTTTTTLPPG